MERANKIQLIQDLLAKRLTPEEICILQMSDAEVDAELSCLLAQAQDPDIDYRHLEVSDLCRLLKLQLQYDLLSAAALLTGPLPDDDRSFVQRILAAGSKVAGSPEQLS